MVTITQELLILKDLGIEKTDTDLVFIKRQGIDKFIFFDYRTGVRRTYCQLDTNKEDYEIYNKFHERLKGLEQK